MGLLTLEQTGLQTLAVWQTTETEEDIHHLWHQTASFNEIPASITHPHRRAQWLASRVLLHHVHPNEKVVYDENGKPWLSVPHRHISFSHTSDYIALLSSPEPCGIDIEIVSPKVERIAHKFLKPEELAAATKGMNPETLYVYWCAKEALYKVYGHKGVSLKENITVQAFSYADAGGKINAVLHHENINFGKTIQYVRKHTYMMAYTLPAAECATNSELY
ncbi:MAG: 4'-phosphopantetheinyl transferase superfamily protein [Bacteroidetes bacterium]|nr:4'-phosphopantetheinyl transferase superfamily protein [Bacteroidota bacterium]